MFPQRLNNIVRISNTTCVVANIQLYYTVEEESAPLTGYRTMSNKLSDDQVRFFRHSGYLKLSETVPAEIVDQMRWVVSSLMERCVPPLTTDSEGRVIRLSEVFLRDSVFSEVFASALVLDPLESLLGPNIQLVLNRHNHATINRGGLMSRRLHRDVLQWTRNVITVVLYLEEATVENGATLVIPGSQYLPFVGTPNNGGTWMDEHSVYHGLIDQAVPVPMPKGGLLAFDSLMFHACGQNKTRNTRMAVTMAYHSVDELHSPAAHPQRILVRGEPLYRGNDRLNTASDLPGAP